MKTIVLGLASVVCGGIALMPLLVQPDPRVGAAGGGTGLARDRDGGAIKPLARKGGERQPLGRATGLNVYIAEPHPQIAEAPPVVRASSFSLSSLFK